jgi:hypothetical protein
MPRRGNGVVRMGCLHVLLPAAAPGWFVCGCKRSLAVCPSCVPMAPGAVHRHWCSQHDPASEVTPTWKGKQAKVEGVG